jgi:L-asparaginase II
MIDPVLVEVVRGPLVETVHRGAVAVSDAQGRLLLALGDVDRPVYPRSAVKAFQALPLLETGAADKVGLTDAEIALAVSSHAGEPLHVETARGMLAKAGRDEPCLECGVHWPSNQSAANDLVRAGQRPNQLHNNCSGKHAGFVCLACASGLDPAGYVEAGHPVQEQVKEVLEAMTGVPLGPERRGIDGCSIPTYGIPLAALARAFARFATGQDLPAERALAAQRIRKAVADHPFMLAGTDKFDTNVTRLLGGNAFIKTGAEGVYCGALPGQGLGIAVKCSDGATRAAQVIMANLLLRLLGPSGREAAILEAMEQPELRNWRSTHIGQLRPASALRR